MLALTVTAPYPMTVYSPGAGSSLDALRLFSGSGRLSSHSGRWLVAPSSLVSAAEDSSILAWLFAAVRVRVAHCRWSSLTHSFKEIEINTLIILLYIIVPMLHVLN